MLCDAELFARLAPLATASCPFVNLPNSTGRSHWGEGITAEEYDGASLGKPTIVVEVSFVKWTRDALLRHPAFVGVRNDKLARQVRRE